MELIYLKDIFETKLEIPENYRQACIKEAYDIGDRQAKKTNVKASMSYWRIHDFTTTFNILLQNILNTIRHNFPQIENNLGVGDAWLSIYKKDDYSQLHHHLPSLLSFTYYLKSDGTTPINFPLENYISYPTNNTLIIFPARFKHEVPKHKNNSERIVLAGNIEYKAK
jgi:hypothetical protein|tara:strand:+ start:188 stop:691 length:504 start_codon:yes stop_codon:yes gene_type:complete